jgi:hypothetical protein
VKAAVDGRTGQSGAPATSPNCWGSTVGASDSWATGQSSGAPDRSYSLSDAPSAPALTSTRAVRTVHCYCSFCRRPLALVAVAPLAHRTVRWIIAESSSRKPEAEEFELIHPGAPDTVRWCTGQFDALDQGCLRFTLLLYFWTLSLPFIGLCWTFGTCRTFNLEQTS